MPATICLYVSERTYILFESMEMWYVDAVQPDRGRTAKLESPNRLIWIRMGWWVGWRVGRWNRF